MGNLQMVEIAVTFSFIRAKTSIKKEVHIRYIDTLLSKEEIITDKITCIK